jgi:hypothetical protein
MLDALMSSMSAPVAGPVQKFSASLASAVLSGLASATMGDLGDDAHPTSKLEIISAVAQPTITATVCSAHIRFMGHSLLSSSNTPNHVVEASAPPDAVPAYDDADQGHYTLGAPHSSTSSPACRRVGDRRGGVQDAPLCPPFRRFRLRARLGLSITPSPAPATSNVSIWRSAWGG